MRVSNDNANKAACSDKVSSPSLSFCARVSENADNWQRNIFALRTNSIPPSIGLINILEKLSGIHPLRKPSGDIIIRGARSSYRTGEHVANADKDIHYRELPVFEFR